MNQKQNQGQRIYWWLPRWGVGVGVWDDQMQVGVYRTDKQQGPTIQYRGLYPASCDKL